MTIDPALIGLIAGVGVSVGIFGAVALFATLRMVRDDRRRVEAADRATADTAARVAKSPHPAFAETLARAPDAFAEARARAAVLAAQIPPEIASGEAPDPRAPRFLWWTTREQAEAVEVTILPPWLARLFARRLCVRWTGVSVWTPPGFDHAPPPAHPTDAGDACVITANEFACVFANPGRVTDLSGNPVAAPVDF